MSREHFYRFQRTKKRDINVCVRRTRKSCFKRLTYDVKHEDYNFFFSNGPKNDRRSSLKKCVNHRMIIIETMSGNIFVLRVRVSVMVLNVENTRFFEISRDRSTTLLIRII